jgi:hypothetical protein
MNLLQRIWDWLAGQFVREIPEEDAVCEFDCRKPQCRQGEWESCIRRLQRATGELMPAKQPTSEAVANPRPENKTIYHDFDRL